MSLSAKSLDQLLELVGLQGEAPPEELQFERTLTDNALRTLASGQRSEGPIAADSAGVVA